MLSIWKAAVGPDGHIHVSTGVGRGTHVVARVAGKPRIYILYTANQDGTHVERSHPEYVSPVTRHPDFERVYREAIEIAHAKAMLEA